MWLSVGLIIGSLIGICVMSMLQINDDDNSRSIEDDWYEEEEI